MAIARRRLTLEEFLTLPEAEPALEFWHGEVTQKVSPKLPHGALQFRFGYQIESFARPGRLAHVFTETRVTFAGESVVPDLIVLRRERIPRDSRGQVVDDITIPPDIAVEIISPGQSRPELIERCRWYVENGVRLAIFVDPRRRVARLFRPGQDSGDLRGASVLDLGDVLPGFSLTVDELFAPLAADWG